MAALLPRIKTRVTIHAHRKVLSVLEGEYASVQSGRSLDFNDLREYVRGDDVKDIDWKASARTRSLLVKRYVATRQHRVLLAVSTGRSMAAADAAGRSKRDLAVFVAGLVGWLAVRHGDRVGFVHGDGRETHVRRAATGEVELERGLEALHDAISPGSPPADLVAVLRRVARTERRRTILVVVCDEYAVSDALAEMLRRLVVQHEVLLVTLADLDPTLDLGARPVVDVTSASTRLLPRDLREDHLLRQEYAALVAEERRRLRSDLEALGVVCEQVSDEASAITTVFRLLERHRHARGR